MNEFEYRLTRYSSQDESTLGYLMAGSEEPGRAFRCYTLEDEYREIKVPGETRIPAGRYEIKLRAAGGMHQRYAAKHAWHRGMLWLQNVPGFEWIYLHAGNTDDHTEGCILVGDGVLSNLPRVGRGSISSSQNAYKALALEIYSLLDTGKRVFVTIVDQA